MFEVVVRENTPDESEIRVMNIRATELSKLKKWDAAVECLERVQKLSPTVGTGYPIKHYLRLPVYLQRAGRFDESMAEFERLIEIQEDYVNRKPKHYREMAWKAAMHGNLSAIYDKMRLACKREKILSDADAYAAKSDEHNNAWEMLQPIVEQERKKRGR